MRRSFASRRWHGLSALAGAMLLGLWTAQAMASEPVTVLMASGRRFTGTVDSRSDQAQLWLRAAENSIILLRPIDWDRVASAQVGEKRFSAAELRAAVAELKSTERNIHSRDASPPRAESSDRSADTTATAASDFVEQPLLPALHASPVRAIQIEATLGHWAAGTEATGIIVTLRPIDGEGDLVAIDGTLEVDLIGQRLTVVTEGNGFPHLGRWTAAVRAADFGPCGAVFQFPFQAVHPDFNLDLEPHGLVHARLSVPGQGVFEASRAMVRVRAYSSVRDHVQQITGSRFLPIERTDRGRESVGRGQ